MEPRFYQNYYIDSYQILHSDRPANTVRGGPNTRETNSRWWTAAILKTIKSRYLGNGSNNR